MKKIKNSKGQVYYGMHFYPGVAEYAEAGKNPYRVFLNEDTIRAMDPSFAGRPVFVLHVDGVHEDIDELKKDVDGWVIESFFNQADGKHWVKFLVCSEKGEQAIKRGMKLSNCYVPKSFGQGGLWNGVSYTKEIRGGEYEHLAIVPNPRYEESVILTPEKFKEYNESKLVELKRLANHKKGDRGMKVTFFKRAKVENSIDLAETFVLLPKTQREASIAQLVEEADVVKNDKVDVDGESMTVAELVEGYVAMKNAMADMEKKAEKKENEDDDKKENEDDEDDEKKKDKKENKEDCDDYENEEDDEEKSVKLVEEEEKEVVAAKKKDSKKKKNSDEEDEVAARRAQVAKEKAERLSNAPRTATRDTAVVEMSADKVARGKARYGSN